MLVAILMSWQITAALNQSIIPSFYKNSGQFTVAINVVETGKLFQQQVVKLGADDIEKALSKEFETYGFLLSKFRPHIEVTGTVNDYKSGSYIGFSKTARMMITYTAVNLLKNTTTTWTDQCVHRAKLDWNDSNQRNKIAVDGCLGDLSAKLTQKLTEVR